MSAFPPVFSVVAPHRTEAGGLALESPLLLAPLAGVTIPPLRLFYSLLGAAAVHTEMISCAGLRRANRKTAAMLDILPGEAPVIVQLFAGDTETMLRGAETALEGTSFRAVGINMACPMPKVLKKGAGARLLENPGTAFSMVSSLSGLGLPVWPKIRKCPPGYPLTTEEFCRGLLDAGASLVCLHGRTPAQRYSGEADREIVGAMAAKFPEKICASGDVYTPEQAADYLRRGCRTVLMARGALADPFLFARTLAFLGYDVHNSYRNPSPDFQMSLLLHFGDSVCGYCGPRMAVLFVKRLLSGMFRGVRGIGGLRRAAARVLCWTELRGILERCDAYFERREECSGCTI
ncbi:tRNA-dihydrouridine synthase family protein [Aminivibrio sp.]|uniref:tRNA dihydrouridine synthase n=1 Tax=Aminivibrio sp. TaxID=1872489 RepID=UPI001A534DA3|nr:tRNA-dihydrouridine synthase family protein [Aminivibrio sp.]MBL3540358.1 tRNA-dihydrouridine synthase family protein [Aminivibrio sp.]MDK2958927.1 tRNA-dihydrouridine synthase [Synergistaceae bacterium]